MKLVEGDSINPMVLRKMHFKHPQGHFQFIITPHPSMVESRNPKDMKGGKFSLKSNPTPVMSKIHG